MAATAAAVAAEEDTELRDLLVQTLENSGALNRIKVRQAAGLEAAGPGRREAAGAGDAAKASCLCRGPARPWPAGEAGPGSGVLWLRAWEWSWKNPCLFFFFLILRPNSGQLCF